MKLRAVTRLVAVGAAMAAMMASSVAAAEPSPPPVPLLTVVATPMFGADATSGGGWSEIVARIDNVSSAPQKGNLELDSAPYGGGDKFTTRAPFNVPPGKSAIVKLPMHGTAYYSPAVAITARGEKGQALATASVSVNATPAPLLVDIDQPSRLSVVMRAWPLATSWSPAGSPSYGGMGTSSTSLLSVGVPSFDRTTGEPILPDHAAGYSAATTVLVHTDVLAKLDPTALDALVSWVIGGGTLAIVANRPEDLRGPVIVALLGGSVTATSAPAHLLTLPGTTRPSSSPGMSPFELDPDDDQTPPPKIPPHPHVPIDFSPPPHGAIVPARSPSARIGPAPDVKDKLTGYTGGNLRESDLGASAAYGLGEVHLLAFDPTAAPMLDDPWIHARMLEMITRAWERRAISVFPHGTGDRNDYRLDEIRRALDPNENFRPGLGISAILLVVYSILAGPVTFLRASKRGRPLSPLLWAPILSAITFGAIVLVGLASKGWRGRARHVALVETGAGVTRGAVRRYRGFFASETKSLAITSTDRSCVLDIATGDSRAHENAVLRLDRNGAALENLTGLPWQTIVIREDGFTDWKGAVSVIANPDGSVDVVNHTGRRLVDVLAWTPHQQVSWFASIEDGGRVRSTAGKRVLSSSARRKGSSGTHTVHPMQARDIGFSINAEYNGKVSTTWSAFETAAGEVDWWPDDVPVVLGEMTGAEKAKSDAGLALESDRVLFRVVGYGGAP